MWRTMCKLEKRSYNLNMDTFMALTVIGCVAALPIHLFVRCGAENDQAARVFYATIAMLHVRDYAGCFYGNFSRKKGDSVRKPLGYKADVLRRPCWISPWLLRRVCSDAIQILAFAACFVGACICALKIEVAGCRVGVAVCYTIVELKFHAALGWHRNVLSLATAWSFALPRDYGPTARVFVLVHSYGGSGVRRMLTGGIRNGGASLREVFRGAVVAGNSLWPRLTLLCAEDTPLALLTFMDFMSRVGLEIVGVLWLLYDQQNPKTRATFRALAASFHQVVAVTTAIDFMENRLILLAMLCDDYWSSTDVMAVEGHNEYAARLFLLALALPVVLAVEHFPFGHQGLFPYNEKQIKRIREIFLDGKTILVGTVSGQDAIMPVNLGCAFLGVSPTLPAQMYHKQMFHAFEIADARTIESARVFCDAWLKHARPLVHAPSGFSYDTAVILPRAKQT